MLKVLFRLESRPPRGKGFQLLVRPVVIALSPVQPGDLRHFFFRKPEIHDIQVVLDVIHVFAAGDHRKAHLGMPAENDLRRCLAVFLTDLRENRFIVWSVFSVVLFLSEFIILAGYCKVQSESCIINLNIKYLESLMTTKQIDYCIEVSRTLNFSRAADNLFVSQPTFSYQTP